MENVFYCGPIAIQASAPTQAWLARVADVLGLYTHWHEAHPPLHLKLHADAQPAAMTTGNFMRCVGMNVDKTDNGLYATAHSGASVCWNQSLALWEIYMPSGIETRVAEDTLFDDNLEDLLELVLTTTWRQIDFIPFHAGAVVNGNCTALLTAPSRGGKTTLTAAMLHRGWQTLGDDKLLLYCPLPLGEGQGVRAFSLQSLFNMDPQTRKWFPEVGDLTTLPLDSAWTPKRRVPIETIWRERILHHASPTHLIQIQRLADKQPTRIHPLNPTEILSTLLHQTVVPVDSIAARQIISTIAALATQVKGLRLELGQDAYEDEQTLDILIDALGRTS